MTPYFEASSELKEQGFCRCSGSDISVYECLHVICEGQLYYPHLILPHTESHVLNLSFDCISVCPGVDMSQTSRIRIKLVYCQTTQLIKVAVRMPYVPFLPTQSTLASPQSVPSLYPL